MLFCRAAMHMISSKPMKWSRALPKVASFFNQRYKFAPHPSGRPEFPEEAYIKKLDGSTGASLKLTILNHSGRVWTMVAGGGASVVYADTISDYGYGKVRVLLMSSCSRCTYTSCASNVTADLLPVPSRDP